MTCVGVWAQCPYVALRANSGASGTADGDVLVRHACRVEELHRKEAASQAAARMQATVPITAAPLPEPEPSPAPAQPLQPIPAELIYAGDSSYLMQGLY